MKTTKDIKKSSFELTDESNSKLFEYSQSVGDSISVDDLFLDKHNNYIKVVAILNEGIVFKEKEWDREEWVFEDWEFDPEYPLSGVTEWSDLGDYKGKIVKINPKENESLIDFEKRKMLEAINAKNPHENTDNIDTVNEKALARIDKTFLETHKTHLARTQQKFQILERILDRQRAALCSYVDEFTKKIKKIMKVIGQIELYLGIHEDIVQIQEGEKAKETVPISLRQQILYMDEEVGNIDDGGLDWENIELFDAWLLKDQRYKSMLPEEKGVVIFRVRRKEKHYSENSYVNDQANIPNKWTYLLIRNGDNIYRIWADIIIHPRLFPLRKEFQELMDEINKEDTVSWHKEDAKDKMFTYRQNILLLQGLIDRTDIFKPTSHQINLFKPDTWGKLVNYVYDDEIALPTGRKSYKNWKEEINSKIVRGTRIYFCGFRWNDLSHDKHYGYDRHRFPYRVRENPPAGVYSVKRVDEASKFISERLICHFNPKDTIYPRNHYDEETVRKQSIPFYLYTRDYNVMNYDLMSLDEVEFYINCRTEREEYYEMLPVLRGIRKMRKKELVWEQGFVDRLVIQFKCDKKIILDAIDWWKHKVIWKRPITEDDAKALRMIESKVRKAVNRKTKR